MCSLFQWHKAWALSYQTCRNYTKHWYLYILVSKGRAPFGQHQESRPLGWSSTGKLRFTDVPQIWQIWLAENTKRKLCACSENRLGPEVAILVADQKERGLWKRECKYQCLVKFLYVWKKNISGPYFVLSRVCLRFCFVSCKMTQNVTFRSYLHDVNSKFPVNSHDGCEALCFFLSDITRWNNFGAVKINLLGKEFWMPQR